MQIAHPTDCKKFIKCYSGKLSGFCLRWKARNYLLIPLILVVGIITSSLEIHSTNQNIRFISKYVGKKVIPRLCVVGRRYTVHTCNHHYLYNSDTSQCDYPRKVTCPRPSHSDGQGTGLRPEGHGRPAVELRCPSGYSGTKPHPKSCTKFIECVHTKPCKIQIPIKNPSGSTE